MQFKIKDIAILIGGTVEGNSDVEVNSVGKIESAQRGDIAFLANPKYEQHIYTTNASAVIVANDFFPKKAVNASLIKVEDPYSSFTALLTEYSKMKLMSKVGIEQLSSFDDSSTIGSNPYLGAFSYVDQNCEIGDNVKIFPHVYIGENVTIGDNTIIYSGVKIYSDTKIGANCVVQANVVIGSDGFGFAPQENGEYKSVPQIGNVIIEDNVSIGANSVIDCATMGSTIIKKGAKLDNLVQIAHNVEVGEHTVIAAQAGFSGSSKIGNHCIVGGQVGIAGHVNIPNKTSIGAQSGIMTPPKNEGESYFGSPAIGLMDWLRAYTIFKKLPSIDKEIKDLKEKIVTLGLNSEE